MIRKILPILLALIGLGGGVGAGLALRPAVGPANEGDALVEATLTEAEQEAAATEPGNDTAAPEGEGEQAEKSAQVPGTQAVPEMTDGEAPLHDYVKLNNQFVVPVVMDGQVASMVILALSLEVTVGGTEQVYALEPKLRDVFLQVMFDHANSGGFSGEFTESKNMVVLRDALREAAIKVLGASLTDVLIIDIARQDL